MWPGEYDATQAIHPENLSTMNEAPTKRNILLLNLAFWAVAIAFPYFIRLLPTASGSPPKIYEVLVPLIQIMLAVGATYHVATALGTSKQG